MYDMLWYDMIVWGVNKQNLREWVRERVERISHLSQSQDENLFVVFHQFTEFRGQQQLENIINEPWQQQQQILSFFPSFLSSNYRNSSYEIDMLIGYYSVYSLQSYLPILAILIYMIMRLITFIIKEFQIHHKLN